MGQLAASKNDRDPAMTEFERARKYTVSIPVTLREPFLLQNADMNILAA